MTTRTEVRDALNNLVNEALAAEELTTEPSRLQFDGKTIPTPDGALTWVRVSVKNQLGEQSAIGKNQQGKRRYRYDGRVYVEVFTPIGDGLSEDDRLATLVLNAMRAADIEGIELLNAAAAEMGVDGAWFKTNVSADFIYYEVI